MAIHLGRDQNQSHEGGVRSSRQRVGRQIVLTWDKDSGQTARAFVACTGPQNAKESRRNGALSAGSGHAAIKAAVQPPKQEMGD